MKGIAAATLRNQQILNKIKMGSITWQHIIPTKEHQRFVKRIQEAVEVYLDLVSPEDLASELRTFEKIIRNSPELTRQSLRKLSNEARAVLYGPEQLISALPDYPSQNLHEEVKSRLVSSQSWRSEAGGKRRKHTRIVGPSRTRGRPSCAKIDVLVSRISAAYASATGEPPTRSWSEAEESNIEKIVEDCLSNIGIDDIFSAKAAVRRHIENRQLTPINPLKIN